MSKISTMKKPTLTSDEMMSFAEGRKEELRTEERGRHTRSGLIPTGDVRLTANIRGDLHAKLKMRSVLERTTIGELIEEWLESWPE